MKKQTMKQLRLGMAILALCGMSAVGGGQTFADETIDSLAARVAKLEQTLGNVTTDDTTTARGVKLGQGAVASDYKYGIAIGKTASATMTDGIAIGNGATANEASNLQGAIAIGALASANQNASIAIGGNKEGGATSAIGDSAIALGTGATATSQAIALGRNASATSSNTIATGYTAYASGNAALANGYYSKAFGAQSIAIGVRAKAGATATEVDTDVTLVGTAAEAIAIGDKSKAYADQTVALGYDNKASGVYAITIGSTSTASNRDSIAIGRSTSVTGDYGVALGTQASAAGTSSLSFGLNSKSLSANSVAIGNGARTGMLQSTDYNAVDLTAGGTAKDANHHYYYKKTTKPSGWTDEGSTTWTDESTGTVYVKDGETYYYRISHNNNANQYGIDDRYSIAIGQSATANDYSGVALGRKAVSNGEYAIAIGGGSDGANGAQATADQTIAVGVYSKATAVDAIAVGNSAQATGLQSLALMKSSRGAGDYSIAIGSGAKALAAATNGMALGNNTEVTTENGTAIGNGASVAVANAIALGYGSKVVSGDGNVLSIGTAGGERKIIHVAAGKANTDAANYGQLLKVDTYTLESSKNYSVTLKTNDGSNGPTIKLDVEGLKTNAGTTTTNADAASVSLNNINPAGEKKIQDATNIVAGDSSVNVTSKTENGVKTYTITATGGGSVTGGGEIKANDDRAVSGDTVYKALGELTTPAEGSSYDKISTSNTVNSNIAALDAGKANTDLSNLSTTGTSQVKSLAQEAVKVTGGSGITVNPETTDGNITYKVSLDYDTIGGKSGVGGGAVASDDKKLVSGDTMYKELRPTNGSYVQKTNTTAANLEALDAAIGADSGYGTKLNNISTTTKYEEGQEEKERQTTVKENIGALDKAMGKVANLTDATTGVKGLDGKVIGSEGSKYTSGNLTTAVQAVDEKVGDASKLNAILDVKGNTIGTEGSEYKTADVTNAVLAVNDKVGNLSTDNKHKDAAGTEINYHLLDGSKSLAENMETVDQYLGDVKSLAGEGTDAIKDKDGKAISADDLAKGGLTKVMKTMDEKIGDLSTTATYGTIKAGNSVNANLTLVDTAIGTDADYGSELHNISKGENVSLKQNIGALDAAIGTTADGAFVSSSNSVGQNLNALDKGLSDLGDRVNKVGAGAAALAALHVQDFDPDNKLNFAVGFGHYKNANSGAIGAFYKPNHDTTFSIASTIGNGDNMLNAGISFKLGKSSHVEKTMVAKADYEALQQKVAAQDELLAAQNERLSNQDAQIEELKKQVAALIARG